MLENIVRNHYQRWLVDPLAVRLTTRITPLHITLLAGVLGLCLIPTLYFHHIYLAISLLLLSGYLDTLDGTFARHTNKASSFGAVLDILMDRLVEFSAIFGLWLIDPTPRALWCLLMLGSILLCITSFLVVGIFTANDSHKGFYYSPGLMERAEAFIFFISMMLFPSAFMVLAVLFIFLVLVTTCIRLIEFRRFLS